MSQATSTSSLSDLSADVRNALTDWLADCDLNWERGRLEVQLDSLPAELQLFRGIALEELVKIDIEHCWRDNVEVTVESYLKMFPDLGSTETVGGDLLLAEWEARSRHGTPPHFGDFLRRFPNQADLLRPFIKQTDPSERGGVSPPVVSSSQDRGADAAPLAETEAEVQTVSLKGRAEADPDDVNNAADAKPQSTHKDASAFDDIPETFGRFRIVRKLGHGGMGDVYLANDTQLNRPVALKVPRFDRRTQSEVLERFDREAKAVANLDHPHICRVYDAGEVDGQRFMVMEFIDGHSLAENKWSDETAIGLVQQVAAAVGAAHMKNIIHRDLKPANIMLTADGRAKVTDFGLARRIDIDDQRLTHSGMILGTPAYMPPEQLTGELDKIGPHSDVYSLGVILFELLTGHLPHDIARNTPIPVLCARILTEPAALPRQFRPDLDPRLEAIILKATAKSHTDRFASMSEFSNALQAVLDEPPIAPDERGGVSPPLSRPTNQADSTVDRGADAAPLAGEKRTRSRTATAVAVILAAVLLLGAIFWFRSGDAIVKVEVLADGVEVMFQNDSLTVTDVEQQYRVKPGEHRLHVKAGKLEFDTDRFTLTRGTNPTVTVEIVNSDIVTKFGKAELSRQLFSKSDNGQNRGDAAATTSETTTKTAASSTMVNAAKTPVLTETVAVDPALQAKMEAMPAPFWEGDWQLAGNELITEGSRDSVQVLTFGDPTWKNYDLTIEVVSDAKGMENSIIALADETARNFWKIDLGAFNSAKNFDLLPFVEGESPWQNPGRKFLANQLHGERGVWYRVEIQVREAQITVLVDGKRMATSRGKLDQGRVGVRSFDDGRARWRNCEVRSPAGELLWKGWPSLKAKRLKFGGHEYAILEEALPWLNADQRCRELGGHLAVIETEAESDFLKSALKNYARNYWLGGYFDATTNSWKWVNGTAIIQPFVLNRLGDGSKKGWIGYWPPEKRWAAFGHTFSPAICEWDTPNASE